MEGDTGSHGFKCDHNEIFHNRGLFLLSLSQVINDTLCRVTVFITFFFFFILYLCLALPTELSTKRTASGIIQRCWGENNKKQQNYSTNQIFLVAQTSFSINEILYEVVVLQQLHCYIYFFYNIQQTDGSHYIKKRLKDKY